VIKFIDPKECILIKREKRFLAYMNIEGEEKVVYCPNSGRMEGLIEPGTKCIISKFQPDKYQWEAAFIENTWVGTNTKNPPMLAKELLKQLFPNESFIPERFVHPNYKADFISDTKIIEVKNVHLKIDGVAYFPDCVTSRGTKQVNIMSNIKDKECYLIYIVQRSDVDCISVADFLDKEYGKAVKNAKNIKVIAYNCHLNPGGVQLLYPIKYLY
jgi:sugar fermentation stimulation protein A